MATWYTVLANTYVFIINNLAIYLVDFAGHTAKDMYRTEKKSPAKQDAGATIR
jgi:hypothetical protein